jgi:hypothetical protein
VLAAAAAATAADGLVLLWLLEQQEFYQQVLVTNGCVDVCFARTLQGRSDQSSAVCRKWCVQ